MKKTTTLKEGRRRLGIQRETLRQIDSLSPDALARVAGGWSGCCTGNTFSAGTKYC